MHQRFSRMRSGWATLAVGALIASLLAVSATTATAVTDAPDERARVNVCVGEALDDWGFTDVSDDHIFHDAINCLAHFGVTIGSGDGSTFSPEDPVERWQMMLFLTRALVPTGINLRPARAQNFTDLGHLNDEARDAIDLLVTNGIATATSGRTFDPFANVDRAEMALLLVRLLEASGDVVEFASNGDILLDANGDGSQSEPDDYFQDARDLVPAATDQAISAAYELGITTGADPTPAVGTAQPGLDLFYRPRSSVTRGQMAAFILRTLGHTMARPRGLSAQYDGTEIRVSLRDDDFEPIDRAPIDAFFIETEDANRAFTSRGVCDEVQFVDGAYLCEIDSSDLETDNDGEVSLTVPETILDGIDTTVWVWTGRDGDVVDRRTDLFRLDVPASAQTRGATQTKISTRFTGSKARFGTTVSVTVQLQDAQGRNVSVGTDGERPAEWEFFEEVLEETTVDGQAVSPETLVERTRARTLRSDSNGRVTFSLSVPDPVRVASRTKTFSLVETTNAPSTVVVDGNLKETSGRTGGEVYYLEFSDAPPVLANAVVTVTFPNPYINVFSSGSVRNVAVVSVHDEYGEAISAAEVSLSSDQGSASSITTQTFTVGRDGVHRFSYNYSGSGGVVETLTATVDPDGDGTANQLTATNDRPLTGHMFWAGLADRDSGGAKYTILFGDVDRNEIIVDANATADSGNWPGANTEPRVIEYDDNDRLDALGQQLRAGSAGVDAFERALAEFLAKTPTDDTGTGACLEWANFNRARDTAEIELFNTGCPGT
ncbi:MAG: S-layer homology domain-containing protein [Acidimicrobiaceae bacterium]|nr:S-layer homology domain-containing protein [Acidimicrobiaceae bacterium]MYH79010.1 S-layer homology domain-containing protein [Acidimicrobiaceae bacterium]